ncbi:MAG: CdaR family protein [Ardenticatenaceae bacterium]
MRGLPSGFYQNATSVALALILAVLIWITAPSNQLEELTFPTNEPYIQINLSEPPEGLIVAHVDRKQTQVNLRIASEQENELQVSDLIAEVDLSDLGPGEHQVEIKVRPQPLAPRVRVLEATPNRINVRLDQIVTATLPIDPKIKNESIVQQTSQILARTVEPLSVTIRGPQSVVELIEQVVAETQLDGASESVEVQVKPKLLGLPADVDQSSLTIMPEHVTVKVDIQLRPGYRDLIVATDIQGAPQKGFWVSEFSVDPEFVTVVGQPKVVSDLEGIVKTEPIDVSDLRDGEFIRDIGLQLPEGVSPLENTLVQVKIKIEPQTSNKRFRLKPAVTGLQPGLIVKEEAIIPSSVNVLISGSITELEELNLDDIAVTLDATDLLSGTHRIEPRIVPPGTLIVESVNPEQVEITIEQEEVTRQIEVPIKITESPTNTFAIVTPNTMRLDLKGQPSVVEQLDPSSIELILNVANLTPGTYRIIPTLSVDQELTLATPLQPVKVTVYNKEELIILSEQVQVVNLEEGLRGTLNQAVIQLYLMGPGDAESLGKKSEFGIQADMDSLGEGTYTIQPTIQLPSNYSLVAAQPEQLEITLQPEQ